MFSTELREHPCRQARNDRCEDTYQNNTHIITHTHTQVSADATFRSDKSHSRVKYVNHLYVHVTRRSTSNNVRPRIFQRSPLALANNRTRRSYAHSKAPSVNTSSNWPAETNPIPYSQGTARSNSACTMNRAPSQVCSRTKTRAKSP